MSQYEVKTVPDGYLVPDAVADKYHELFDAELAEANTEIEKPADTEPTPVVEEEKAVEKPADDAPAAPAGNASQDAWVEFGKTQPGWVDDDANLSRDELRTKFGPQK